MLLADTMGQLVKNTSFQFSGTVLSLAVLGLDFFVLAAIAGLPVIALSHAFV